MPQDPQYPPTPIDPAYRSVEERYERRGPGDLAPATATRADATAGISCGEAWSRRGMGGPEDA